MTCLSKNLSWQFCLIWVPSQWAISSMESFCDPTWAREASLKTCPMAESNHKSHPTRKLFKESGQLQSPPVASSLASSLAQLLSISLWVPQNQREPNSAHGLQRLAYHTAHAEALGLKHHSGAECGTRVGPIAKHS